jgi:hypothetical protein
MERLTFALWWVEPGHVPTVAEAKATLDHYGAFGASDRAFGWADLPEARAWTARRCA